MDSIKWLARRSMLGCLRGGDWVHEGIAVRLQLLSVATCRMRGAHKRAKPSDSMQLCRDSTGSD
jgi:hypothetical protein